MRNGAASTSSRTSPELASRSNAPCSRAATASRNPNSRQASNVGTGRHFPNTSAARAMNPLPAVMSLMNAADCAVDR